MVFSSIAIHDPVNSLAKRFAQVTLFFVFISTRPFAWAGVSVQDDAGKPVSLRHAAERVVSLAPHVTELLFAIGAGEKLVGAVEYSDFPDAAKRLPRIGSGAGLDLEKIVSLKPDLIISWHSGNPSWQVQRLRELGFPVFESEPRKLEDVAKLMQQFGTLTGTEPTASTASNRFRQSVRSLRERNVGLASVTVFYQILDQTLLTVNHEHLINDVIQLCGGVNVFSNLPGLTQRVSIESVLQKNPDAIIASGFESMWPDWKAQWQAWSTLSATQSNQLYFIPPDVIHRNTPRILQGAEHLCTALDKTRSARRARMDRFPEHVRLVRMTIQHAGHDEQ